MNYKITEDYCSFEIAKLLKEKGFDNEEVSENGGFYCDYECDGTDIGIVYESEMLNKDLARNEYLRPTHQMALKWLREVHNVLIYVNEYGYPDKEKGRQYTFVAKIRNMKSHIDITQLLNDSYEQAIEAALLYVFEIYNKPK